MKTDVAGKWVTALETGALPDGRAVSQAKGWLKVDDGKTQSFCCLGVLCELAILDGVEVERGTNVSDESLTYDGESQELPASVKEWAGLSERNPTVRVKYKDKEDEAVYTITPSLAELNDEYEYSFKKIAKIIKKNVKKGRI